MRAPRIHLESVVRIAFGLSLSFALLISAPAFPARMVLDVIQLHHRSAAEVEPLIRDFVDKEGTLKAADNKLIVRSSLGNLKELRDLVAILDTPQRRLLVTVKQLSGDRARQADREDARHIWRTEDGDDDSRVQQLRVLEDQEAFIDVGREIPIVDFAVAQSQSGTIMEQKTRYVGTTTGFYVRIHLDGDRVRAQIFPHQKMRSGLSSPPEFNAQTLHTTVSGSLGRWLTIGASGGREDTPEVIEYSASARNSTERRIQLQVRLDKP